MSGNFLELSLDSEAETVEVQVVSVVIERVLTAKRSMNAEGSATVSSHFLSDLQESEE